MANQFSNHSRAQLRTLHPHLRRILRRVLRSDDFKVLQGARSDAEQRAAFDRGASKVRPPNHPHRVRQDGFCWAADLEPWINGKPLPTQPHNFGGEQMAQFAWFLRKVKEEADRYFARLWRVGRWRLRFGINWDRDTEILTDQRFDDWYHIELEWIK